MCTVSRSYTHPQYIFTLHFTFILIYLYSYPGGQTDSICTVSAHSSSKANNEQHCVVTGGGDNTHSKVVVWNLFWDINVALIDTNAQSGVQIDGFYSMYSEKLNKSFALTFTEETGTAILWDLLTTKELHTLQCHRILRNAFLYDDPYSENSYVLTFLANFCNKANFGQHSPFNFCHSLGT